MNPLQRLKLVKELNGIRNDAKTASGIAKLKMVKRSNEILAELGFGATPTPVPAPELLNENDMRDRFNKEVEPSFNFMQSIIDGKHDGLAEADFVNLAYQMQESAQIIVNSERKGEGDSVIDSAVTHWATIGGAKGYFNVTM